MPSSLHEDNGEGVGYERLPHHIRYDPIVLALKLTTAIACIVIATLLVAFAFRTRCDLPVTRVPTEKDRVIVFPLSVSLLDISSRYVMKWTGNANDTSCRPSLQNTNQPSAAVRPTLYLPCSNGDNHLVVQLPQTSSDYSISLWVKTESISSEYEAIPVIATEGLAFHTRFGSRVRYESGEPVRRAYGDVVINDAIYLNGPHVNTSPQEWLALTFVYCDKCKELWVYINGVLAHSADIVISAHNPGEWRLGERGFRGWLYKLAYRNYAMSHVEIQDEYQWDRASSQE